MDQGVLILHFDEFLKVFVLEVLVISLLSYRTSLMMYMCVQALYKPSNAIRGLGSSQ